MRFWSLYTCRSMVSHGKCSHLYMSLFIACVLLLESLPSKLSCLRRHILGITPGVCFSDNPALIGLAVDTCSTSRFVVWRATSRVIPFLRVVLRNRRRVLSTGFCGGEPWSWIYCQAPILSHFGQAMISRWLVYDDGGIAYLRFRSP